MLMKVMFINLIMSLIFLSSTQAQSVNANTVNVNTVSGDPIDINGYVQQPRVVTDPELEQVNNELQRQNDTIQINEEKADKYQELSKSTEKLAETTEEMIEERNEAQGEIEKYNKKIDCLMNGGGKECDQYLDKKATSSAHIETTKPDVKEQVSVTPLAGITGISGQNESLESNVSAGVRVESTYNERLSFGVGFHYMSLTTQDYQNGNYINPSYYPTYSQFYNVREIGYTNMSLEFLSKYYLTRGSKFKPYVGAVIGYNRSTMKYEDNRSFNQFSSPFAGNPYQFGNEEINTSFMTGKLISGAEVKISDSMALNTEVSYARALGSYISSNQQYNGWSAPDQLRLNDLNNEIMDADIFSLNIGLMIQF